MDRKQLEGFVLLRDGLSMAADGINKIIETTEPKETQKPTDAEFNAPNWVQKEGTRGVYEQIENDKSQAFKKLADYVKSKGGYCNLFGFKVFFHYNNESILDRKR